MTESSFTILRVRGIPIGVHWTWLLVFAIVVWSLGTVLFPATYPGLDGATYLAMAVAAALLFFGSVLAHELGHALRALDEGQQIEGITLWLFGGVARLRGSPHSPGTELRVAAAGPAVSVALAALFGGAALAGDRLDWPAAVQGVVDYLGRINLILLAFNLVPALPLDGGRILRAWLWRRQASFVAATRSAARAGRAFGIVLVTVGLLELFTGAGLGGVWLVFLGWFLIQAAQDEATMALQRQVLGGRRVRDLMTPDPVAVPPDLSVAELIELAARARRFSTYPVVEDGRLVGVVPLRAAATAAARGGHEPAGLAYALTIADLLAVQDYASGRTIAATGTIQPDGEVGEVGGVEQKAIAAADAGARLFRLPREELQEARGAGIPVQGVDRLEQALRPDRAGPCGTAPRRCRQAPAAPACARPAPPSRQPPSPSSPYRW
jgi:Zn-dependent protease/CBS domain-containing protein